jgi:hypothetical protein
VVVCAEEASAAVALARHRSPHGQGLSVCLWLASGHGVSEVEGVLGACRHRRSHTDDWGAYPRHLDAADLHQARNTQKIERKHLTLRPGSNVSPQDDCFSKSTQMHDIVIGLFVNRYEFGLLI